MPSLKSRLTAFVLNRTRKKAFASADAMNRWIANARLTQDHRPPLRVARRVDIRQRHIDGFPVYVVRPKSLTSDLTVLYLHGGAYVFEMTSYHWRLIGELCERLGCRFVVPIYPLAPEHDFHSMFGMVRKVYAGLLDETDASRIVFMGDSAGGNMAVVLTMMAALEGLPTPARHVLISPGLDMSLQNPELFAVEAIDPWLGVPGGREAIRHYAAGIDVTDWRISPAYGDLTVLPKTLLFAGSRDLLTPDTLVFADRARQAGVEVEVVLGDGMFHVWPLIDMPEARQARDRIVAFIADFERDRAGRSRRAA